MHIKRAKQEIKDSIEAYLKKDVYGEYVIPSIRQRPLFLMGPPGIGKTQIMEQVARECGIGLVSYTITHHTRQSAIGLPFIKERKFGGWSYQITEYTMSEIIASVYEKMEKTGLKEGILFIDEINCVSETLAPAMLQFLQCKTFGNQKVPEGWIIVAAGNPPEYNRSVREFDVVTLDRIKRIDVEENYEVWKAYAYEAGIHPAILSYLDLKREHFYRMETTPDGRAFATARGWEDLSELLKVYESLGKKADREVVHQYIQHWKIAKDFAVYLELYEKYQKDYGLEEIFKGQWEKETLEKLAYASFDERLSVVGMLSGKLREYFRRYVFLDTYVTRLYEALRQAKQDVERMDELGQKETAVYERLQAAEQLTREEDHLWREVLDALEGWQKLVKEEHLSGEAAFGLVKEQFQKEVDRRQTAADEAGEALDRVFAFLEAAFGDSQEMVVFVTDLNTNASSLKYLKENDCDKYHRYNKRLLFDEQREEILSQMDAVEEGLSGVLKEDET